jgi:hypothetical protein
MDRRSVVARRRKSVRGEHLAGLSVVRVHLVSTLHISDTVAAVDRALTAWSGRVVVTLVEHPGGRAAAAPVPPPRRAHLLRRPGNRRRSTANATSPLARRATSSRSHRRNRARSGCPIRPRHSSPDPTSSVSKVICRRCRSNPHTIAIRDLLDRERTLGKPHGCPRTGRGRPHTLNVLEHPRCRRCARNRRSGATAGHAGYSGARDREHGRTALPGREMAVPNRDRRRSVLAPTWPWLL